MRRTAKLLTLFLILGFNSVYGHKSDTLNLYFQALKLHINYWEDFYKKRPDLVKIPEVYFVEQNDYTTDSLPRTINGHKIQVLNSYDLYEKTKKEGIHLIAIRPARWEKGRLVIHVIDFGVSRKRKHYFYSNSGGSSFEIIGQKGGQLSLRIIYQGGI